MSNCHHHAKLCQFGRVSSTRPLVVKTNSLKLILVIQWLTAGCGRRREEIPYPNIQANGMQLTGIRLLYQVSQTNRALPPAQRASSPLS
ncbi:hypothetical protein RRG08_035999 [Elysia crispata]|uniref:Uncharacterized protein n=1 Tax=Elysia crispata TaxID=231223 RepID=A0AAE1E0E0_9GAST|nr:hypothetical protein RRG08_035999 [Elysia crispata]